MKETETKPDLEPVRLADPTPALIPYLVTSAPGVIKVVPARNFTPAARTKKNIDLVVIHATDGAEGMNKAEDCAARFAGRDAPRASAHYAADSNSVVQCVSDKDIAWHAPGANSNGLGVELCGRARQTRAEWFDTLSLPSLCIGAVLVARLCKRYEIPVHYVNRDELMMAIPKARGITTHFEVNKAFGKSKHTDPGPGFPIDWFLLQVQSALRMI